jgi:hypothetical protein
MEATMLIVVFLIWLIAAMFLARKIAPAAHEDDLVLVIVFSVFWPVAGVAFHYWAKAQKGTQP